MRALSIQQPYAELILLEKKAEEYRSRRTKLRECVYIHATHKRPRREREQEAVRLYEAKLDVKRLPRGVLVGTVEIVDCEGDEGDFVWLLANPKRLKKPVTPKYLPNGSGFFFPFDE